MKIYSSFAFLVTYSSHRSYKPSVSYILDLNTSHLSYGCIHFVQYSGSGYILLIHTTNTLLAEDPAFYSLPYLMKVILLPRPSNNATHEIVRILHIPKNPPFEHMFRKTHNVDAIVMRPIQYPNQSYQKQINEENVVLCSNNWYFFQQCYII